MHPRTPVSKTLSHSVAYFDKVGRCSLISKGVFENMQDVAALLTAFQILIKEDKKNES
jgi:hypothetical protein